MSIDPRAALSQQHLGNHADFLKEQVVTQEELESLPYSLYFLLKVDTGSNEQQLFDAWCKAINEYRASDYWNSLPADWPERVAYERAINVAAKALFKHENRRLYNIYYIVTNCIPYDWTTADLTNQERDYMMKLVIHKINSTKVTMDTANALYDSTIQRATAARTAASEQWNKKLGYFQQLPTAAAALAAVAAATTTATTTTTTTTTTDAAAPATA